MKLNHHFLCECWYIQFDGISNVRLRKLVLGDEDTGHPHTLEAKNSVRSNPEVVGRILWTFTYGSDTHRCHRDTLVLATKLSQRSNDLASTGGTQRVTEGANGGSQFMPIIA